MTRRKEPINLPAVAIHAKDGMVRLVKAYTFDGDDSMPASLTYHVREHPELLPWIDILMVAQKQIAIYAELNRP